MVRKHFDPAKHPRRGKGDPKGGQFAPKFQSSISETTEDVELSFSSNDGIVRKSTNPQRLLPNSVSLSTENNSAFGSIETKVTLLSGSKILNISMSSKNGNFWDFGPETATPIQRGQEIFKFAVNNGVDVVVFGKVPYVNGKEFAVINLDKLVY